MLIENAFTVARPVDEVWNYLLDVEKIAPCLPGAELTETIDDHTWKGKVNMKLGPVSMSFAGTVEMAERDDASHRVVLRARGTEQKGKGAADAKVTSWPSKWKRETSASSGKRSPPRVSRRRMVCMRLRPHMRAPTASARSTWRP